jgi:hypothetical protein
LAIFAGPSSLPFKIGGHLDITRLPSGVRPLVELTNALGDQFQLVPLSHKHVVPPIQAFVLTHLKLTNP